MSAWQAMSAAPLDGSRVLLAFVCPISGKGEVSPGYFDDGMDDDCQPVEEPAWYIFDGSGLEIVEPAAWQPYPSFSAEALS